MNLKGNWELAGHVSVDSGTLMIVDPCYVDEGFDYDAWCDSIDYSRKDGLLPEPVKLSFAAGTAWGDGTYPVYVRKDSRGKITAMMVDTDPTDDEDED